MTVDSLAYAIKARMPIVFNIVERFMRFVTLTRHGAAIARAKRVATVHGTIGRTEAHIRPLSPDDVSQLSGFLVRLTDDHCRYFHPHGFAEKEVRATLASGVVVGYGIFAGEALVAYCLIKVFPTTSAYCGLVVVPDFAGRGIGKYLWQYLAWQCGVMNVRARATIHDDNLASLKSLESVIPGVRRNPLTDGYYQVLIPTTGNIADRPRLNL